MIRLYSATRDEGVDPFCARGGCDETELADLVPPKAEWECVISLDQEARPHADRVTKARSFVDGRGERAQRDVRE
jgi:hypothetical protein